METTRVSTPFGRRSMTLGMLAHQLLGQDIAEGQAIDKWKLFRAVCEAKPFLGVTDRALSVLNALLTFYPSAILSEENGLVVFPSNSQLSLRAHGMAEATLRRHLAVLVDAGLLSRKDSPNGKRYARKDRAGGIDQAFGFSFAPLLARVDAIVEMAAQVVAERQQLQHLREQITLCRRDIAKLIETAMEENTPGDWTTVHLQFRALVQSIPRGISAEQATVALDQLLILREEILKQLEEQIKNQKTSGNDGQNERHKHNSNPKFTSDLEPALEKSQGQNQNDKQTIARMQPKVFPLGMVLGACNEIIPYGPQGQITSWRDLMAAAIVVRTMLNVSPSAYQQACEVMGQENAAAVMACILERGGKINSAGGYLRDLTRRAEEGEFSLGPMLMALLRANGTANLKTG
jgi:replication initiation protein RepC